MAGANYTKEMWIKEAGEATLPTRWLKTMQSVLCVYGDNQCSVARCHCGTTFFTGRKGMDFQLFLTYLITKS